MHRTVLAEQRCICEKGEKKETQEPENRFPIKTKESKKTENNKKKKTHNKKKKKKKAKRKKDGDDEKEEDDGKKEEDAEKEEEEGEDDDDEKKCSKIDSVKVMKYKKKSTEYLEEEKRER